MEYRRLGRTELECSAVGLGTWAFNSSVYGPVDRKAAIQAIDAAREVGINLFDTAPLYGTGEEDGIAESVLGMGLRECRKEVIISTKFGRKPTEGNKANFNGRYARQSVEESLKRLGDRLHRLIVFSLTLFSSGNRRRRMGEPGSHEKRRESAVYRSFHIEVRGYARDGSHLGRRA